MIITKSRFYLFFIGIFILFPTVYTYSQQTIKDSILLTDLIVTGSKTTISRKLIPITVSQITQKEIESTGQINILPALNYFVPGIFVTERNNFGFGVANGGSGSITMRGISSSPNTDVLILIDGHPQYQGIFGHPLADAYVASDVEKVEVIRGPASILYGSNAMAGAINIITRKQHKEGLAGTWGNSFGSYNTQKYYGTAGYKKDKLSVFISANHDQTDGTRKNTNFNISNEYLKVAYEINKNLNVTADVNIAGFEANDNGPVYTNPTLTVQPHSVFAAPVPFGIDIIRGKTSLSIENKYDKAEGAFKIYHNFGEHTLTDGFHSTDRNSGGMLYQTFKPFSNNRTTIGTDFKQYGGTANKGIKKDSLITVNEAAVYVYTQQNLLEKVSVSGGIRLENNSKFGTEIVPMAGLTYHPTSFTTFKSSFSKGYRSPTVMEMYLYAPNPILKPERLLNYEISWLQSVLNSTLNFELSLFKLIGENFIQVVPAGGVPVRQNVGTINNQGIEFSAKYDVLKNLFIHANYSYVNIKKEVIAAPRQQLNISANLRYNIMSLNVSAQYIEKLYTFISPNPLINAVIQPDYLVLNTRITIRPIQQLELFVVSNNLLNQRYEINYGYPMPGINFSAGVNMKF